MTNTDEATAPADTPISTEDLDLTPDGLNDAPAHQQDNDSIVHIEES